MFEGIQLYLLKKRIEAITESQSTGDWFYGKEDYIRGFTLEQDKEFSMVRGPDKFSYMMNEEEYINLKYKGQVPEKMFNQNIKSDEYLKVESWRFLTQGIFNGVNLHATNRMVFEASGTVEKLPESMMKYVELIADFRAEQCFNRNTLNKYDKYLKDDENNFMPFSYWSVLFTEQEEDENNE